MAFKPIRVRDLPHRLDGRSRPSRRGGSWLGTGLIAWTAIFALAQEASLPTQTTRDDSIERAAAALETDRPEDRILDELASASPLRLRAVVEAGRRPFGAAAIRFVEALERRPDPSGRDLAIDYLARLSNPEANRRLASELESDDPLLAGRTARVLQALSPVVALESTEAVVRHLRSASSEVRLAARAAAASLARQLLAEARTDDALAVLDRVCSVDPGRLEFEISRAITRGVYAGEAKTARTDLLAITLESPQVGALATDRAELELAAATVAFFAGAERDAFAELALARSRLATTSERKNASSLAAGRIDLATAVAALASTTPDEVTARTAIRRAIAARPHDDGVYLGDNSLFGPAAPRAWLEHLRRRGRPEVRREFYRLLCEELVAAEPPVAADDEIPARSWAPVWRCYALLDDGRIDEVKRLVTDLLPRLERATAWADRWMIAELDLAAGIAEHLSGDSGAALARVAIVERRVLELAAAEVDQLAFDSREIVPSPGSPPLRDSLRDLRMRVERLAAEASFVVDRPADALRRARLAVAADPFDDASTALELAAAVRCGESRERAKRAFDTLPRSAGALLDLSRLAFALGSISEGNELFARHLAWNALTDERRALEQARRDRDPSLSEP